ncbi:MAG TPA: TadE/TadG family type IV pilus assembly protein [Candidatus Acidoferrales bacterium]|nr:TadE/TadG family type IV pilus assembly protein [Candidatus Acidoferrales bacterium]
MRVTGGRKVCLRGTGQRERGSEMLEFAFVVTLLMMLLMGIVTFARAYNIYQSILRAAREGARMAVLPNCATCGNTYIDPSTGVTQANSAIFSTYISPALRAANLNPNSVQAYSESIGWLNSGDTEQHCGVAISFQYPYQLALPFTSANFTTLNIPVQVQMRRENQPVAGGTCP